MTRTEDDRRKRMVAKWNARLFELRMPAIDFCKLIDMDNTQFSKYLNCRLNPPKQKTIDKINKKLKELEDEQRNNV